MYLTAQRVVSSGNENGINGFLYEHGVVAWDPPPDPVSGMGDAIGELVHSLISVTPGDNRVVSYVDIVAPDGTPYEGVFLPIFTWMTERSSAREPFPWVGVVGDMRFGLHMVSAYAKTWREEVSRLLSACQMTLERRLA